MTTDDGVIEVRRALVSVWDKSGIVDLCKTLGARGVEIVSSGGTAAALAEGGVAVTLVSDVTGAAEILEGRVKTLHPSIHGGLLADLRKDRHREELEEQGIAPFQLVVCNLYPFERTIAAEGVTEDGAVEQIDIGGPAMVRAAAKNFHSVAVVVRPSSYPLLVEAIEKDGGLTLGQRRELALEAFASTAAYDAAIAGYLSADEGSPQQLVVAGTKLMDLRYGENSHQVAAFYRRGGTEGGLAGAEQLQGKELSYNNLLDADAAWRLVSELPEGAAAIVKHSNPCGAAVGTSLADAYRKALDCDLTSAFGGIVGLNGVCDEATAAAIAGIFTEVVVAPGFEEAALDVLRQKKNLRILRVPPGGTTLPEVRSVSGGLLLQSPDPPDPAEDAKVVTKAQPSPDQLADLRFAWVIAKHVKSNAIVLAKEGAAVGVGAGQMSRVEATELAARRAGARATGTVCASDAFFPFRDGLDAAAEAGAVAVIQPGGSVRDDEVIAAADEHGIPMLFTGRRHFRH